MQQTDGYLGAEAPSLCCCCCCCCCSCIFSMCTGCASFSRSSNARPLARFLRLGTDEQRRHAQARCWSCTCSTLKLHLYSCGTPGRPVRCVREDWGMECRGEGRAVFAHLVAGAQKSGERILAVAVAQLSKRLTRLQFHSYTRRASMPAVTCHSSHLPPLIATLLISAIWKRYFRFHFQSGESIRPEIVVCTQLQRSAHKNTSCGCHLPLPCPSLRHHQRQHRPHAAATDCAKQLWSSRPRSGKACVSCI